MSKKPDPVTTTLEAQVAQKMTKKNPKGVYYVEEQNRVIGPYQKQSVAQARTQRETKGWSAKGGKGKRPELTFKPRGNKSEARYPNGTPVPRQAPNKARPL